eukprot:gnl/MRDRNA2_/MRDRNA2_28959_c0_seq2.p1 gnl/MRDRNA2_/MRDRNA2_28959_c0~~gnl/MRDRNA2_/MRDRNA2_28959_c0_seq2.p1  ORF type:complete len:121 (+),score=30.39 gnl/MRDRNA2_/MRDRNA2_28959_c0_seq2:95-457(+)
MPTSELKNWNDEKGFGFVGSDDGGDDLFVHRTSFRNPEDAKGLGKGDTIKFDVEYDDRKGKDRAVNATVVSGGGGGGRSGGGGRGRGRDDSRDRGRGGGGGRRDSRDRGRGGRSRSRGRR